MRQEPFSGEFREGMPLLGGSFWIDFVNTTPIIKGEVLDLIGTESALSHWAAQANIGTPDTENRDDPATLHALRAQLADAFDRLAASEPLPAELIATINGLIERSSVRRRIGAGAAVEEHVEYGGPPVASAVAWDFAHFLDAFEHQRMRHCDNPACTMQFYDVGKNNRRRWCTMSLCGNRDKVAQYRERKATARQD
jgi:predicted RNA-binding Zn ribbon-like protein